MKRLVLAAALLSASPALAAPHNVVIFVADGLRYASVTPDVAPTLSRIRREGVDFANSHALYPTLTTANASGIATGHYLGDTGDYANVIYTGFPLAALQGSNVPFLENDAVLQEVKAHFPDGYMGPSPLLCAAEQQGYAAAVIGKLGPAAIQAIDCLGKVTVIDDTTDRPTNIDGSPSGAIPLAPETAAAIEKATGSDQAPLYVPAISPPSVFTPPATPPVENATASAPSAVLPVKPQLEWFADATDEALLPAFKARGKPFVLLFWSRDPDGTQHGQQDSLGTTMPGINGGSSKAAITRADAALASILETLKKLGLDKTTDVFVTADHGFSTIAKSVPDAKGDLPPPMYPQGFLAIDVSNWLGQKLFDPDAGYQELDLASGTHPVRGNGLIGASADAPTAIVAANGGSDFIYTPGAEARAHAKTIFDHLLNAPYVGALFVNDALMRQGDARDFAGALPLSEIRLIGSSNVPQPAIVVGYRSFAAKGCKLGAELCAVEIADTSLQTGGGMHGSPSRADTRNFMAAIGPDFKAHFVDTAPVGNADIAPTLAHILGVDLSGRSAGILKGRVIREALRGGGGTVSVSRHIVRATPAANGVMTVLYSQSVDGALYIDAAGIPGRVVGLKGK